MFQHSSRPRDEQSLVEWASIRLHDNESLQQMVDPGIRKTFPPRFLSGYADIVSLCIQVLQRDHLHSNLAVKA